MPVSWSLEQGLDPRIRKEDNRFMTVGRKDSIPIRGSMAEEILHVIRSEPALAWFLAQALWVAQPTLEAIWPQEKITAVADFLETADSASDDGPSRPAEDGGGRKNGWTSMW